MNLVQRIASVNERTLDRLIRVGIAAIVIGIVAGGVIFYFDRYPAKGPSLIERRVEAAESAVRKTPRNPGLRIQLAEIYRAANKPDKALDQYDTILKVDAGHRAALLGRAEILAAKGNYDAAAESFKKVIGKSGRGEFAAVDPQLKSAYYGLGSIALKKNQPRDAIGALQKAIKVDATDSDAWYLLGVAYLKISEPRNSVKALQRALLFVPTGWCDPYQRLSEAYALLNRKPFSEYAGAMVDFCRKKMTDAERRLAALTAGPAAVEAMIGLGMIAETRSNRDAAVHWYRKVIAVEPSNVNARTSLDRLTTGTGSETPSTPPGHPSTN